MERRRSSKSLIVCSALVSGSVILTALVFLTKPSLAEAFKTNMVVTIQVFCLVLFIPLYCVVWCMDRQKQKLLRKEMNVKCRSRTLAFDEDKRQIKKKKKNKRLPPKLVPDPPEAVYYRMGSRSSSLKNQTTPSLHSQRNG